MSNIGLGSHIKGIGKGEEILSGSLRVTFPAEADLGSDITSVAYRNLAFKIRAVTVQALEASVASIEPLELEATIDGKLILDLGGKLTSVNELGLEGSIHGYSRENLKTMVVGRGEGDLSLPGNIRGVGGMEVPDDINSRILPTLTGVYDIEGSITGIDKLDLEANIINTAKVDLGSEISGAISDWILITSIEVGGGYSNLLTHVRPTTPDDEILSSQILSQNSSDIHSTLQSDLASDLLFNIESSDTFIADLGSNLTGVDYQELSAIVDYTVGNTIQASIDTKLPNELQGLIRPRVVYLDNSLFINTYPYQDLRVTINNYCENISQTEDLSVFLNVNYSGDVEAEIISLSGTYVQTWEGIPIETRNLIQSEGWMRYVIDQPAVTMNTAGIVLTNWPLSNLSANIQGVLYTEDIQATLQTQPLLGVRRASYPAEIWMNLKTGERKVINIEIIGKPITFYYSSIGENAFQAGEDEIRLTVHSYLEEDQVEETLLYIKRHSKLIRVHNIDKFPTLDDAIRDAIVRAVGYLNQELSATILPQTPNTEELTSEISGELVRYEDLLTSTSATTNDPTISATLSGTL